MDVRDSKHYLELVAFIKTAREKGIPDGQIQKSLTDVGWAAHDIAAGFSFVDQNSVSLIHGVGPEATSHPLLFYRYGRWVVGGVIACLIFLLLFIVYGQSFFGALNSYFSQWNNGGDSAHVVYDVPTQTTSTVITTLLVDETVSRFEFTPSGAKAFYLETSRGRTIGTLPQSVSAPLNPYSSFSLATSGVKTGFVVTGVPLGIYFDYVQLPIVPSLPATPFVPSNLATLPYIASDDGVFFIVNGNSKGPSYDAILKLWISPDGRHQAYSALKKCAIPSQSVTQKIQNLSTKKCNLVLVVDGVERPIEKIPALGAFSPVDGSFSFVDADPACVLLYEQGSDRGFSCHTQVVTAQGGKSPVFDFVRNFGFTTTGALAYSARVGNKEAVFVAGKSQGEFDAINGRQLVQSSAFPTGIFSSDGIHIVYSARSGGDEALFFDGVQLPLYKQILAVSYSGETKTLYYAAIDSDLNVVVNTVRF